MIKFIKKKIILKLTAIIIASIAIAITSFIVYSNNNYMADSRKKLDNQISDLLFFATNANIVPLFNLDVKTINEMNKALMKNPMIVAVNIYIVNFENDRQGVDQLYSSLAKKDYKTGSSQIIVQDSAYKIPLKIKDIKMVQNAILFNGEVFGKIQLFYTDHFMTQDVRSVQITNIVSYIMLACFLVVTILIFLSLYFIKPIINLAEQFKKSSKLNDYNVRIAKTSDDEIGILQNGFNQFLNNIQNREIERNNFEAELKKTKNYLHNIIDSMPSLLITTDTKGIISQCNFFVTNLIGKTEKELVGLKITSIFPFLEEIFDQLNITDNCKPFFLYRQNLENISKSANISVYPLLSEGMQGWVFRIDDMAELENKEEQLRQIQKMETIGTLAGGLAHDFNNVLSGIVGTLSLLKFKMTKSANLNLDELKAHLDTMDESSKRAVDLVQQLMTLSRKQELSMTPVDLNLSVKHVLKICQNTFDKCVSIRFDQMCGGARIMADPTQIEQVILNICVNAYHSMTMMRGETETLGGLLDLRISMLKADKHFCSTHQEAEAIPYWRLDMADSGIGMNSSTISKIFEPFYTTKEKNKGTGLGLSMAYNIIKQHKGFIDVYSEIGHGTTFSIFLPVLSDIKEIEIKHVEQDTQRGRGTILVVDDEEVMRMLVKEMLEECGYDLLVAEDGEAGLTLYQQNCDKIDLVLLDMIMPKKSGPETFLAIRQITPDAKIVLTSGFRLDEKAEKLLENGASAFIQKPYTLSKLSEVIFKALGK